MQIMVHFLFNGEIEAEAITGVEGAVTDFILPNVGDFVRHHNAQGVPFVGKVASRMYSFEIPNGVGVDGTVTVTLSLDRVALQ